MEWNFVIWPVLWHSKCVPVQKFSLKKSMCDVTVGPLNVPITIIHNKSNCIKNVSVYWINLSVSA